MAAGELRQSQADLTGGQGSVGPASFGSYALSPGAERLRRFGQSLGRSMPARWACSAIRRIIGATGGPYDVVAFDGQHARLYPDENLTDKRVFAAVQFWDPAERAALGKVVRTAPEPAYMIDAGANAGLYTLAARAEAGPRSLHVLAIEPDPENLARLRFNLAASGANDVQVAEAALSDRVGETHIASSHANRGELSIGSEGTRVQMAPLADLVSDAGFPRVDALKIDIEGMEEPVLDHYFNVADPELWPSLIVIEAQRGADTPALALLQAKGYIVTQRTRMNAILALDSRSGQSNGRS